MPSKNKSAVTPTTIVPPKNRIVETQTLTFKEVLNSTDLVKCFRLRYRRYNTPAYRYFLNENTHQLDIDAFDTHSRHWAVYSDKNVILGYARIIQKEENRAVSHQIRNILDNYSISTIPLLNEAYYLPIHRYQSHSSKSSIDRFFELHQAQRVVELSRFMIPKTSPRRTSKFMVNAGLGIYRHLLQVDSVLLACNDTHEKFWSMYGFRNIHEHQTYNIGTLKSVNLHSDFTGVYPTLNDRMKKFADQFQLKNEITIRL